ncbi:rod-determining factor RdfA [Halopelagius fulvigenes]|uniref:Rod-determining factor RdfA n=1 Tax=Halopelagius fulvigenes TaxID=1198324 RepID=A0ABD5TRY8_9EURY
MSTEGNNSSTTGRGSKVGRLIGEYGLEGEGERLETYWTTDGEDRRSLRELADYFNRRLLRATMEAAGMNPLDGEVENTYRLLTDDDVSRGMQTQARQTLEREGVDVESLRSDFVSHQAIHTYLTKYREASREEQADVDRVEKGLETIQRLRSRTSAVSENIVENLAGTERIDLGDFEVLVDVRVFCRDCGTQYDVQELLNRGGCECGGDLVADADADPETNADADVDIGADVDTDVDVDTDANE